MNWLYYSCWLALGSVLFVLIDAGILNSLYVLNDPWVINSCNPSHRIMNSVYWLTPGVGPLCTGWYQSPNSKTFTGGGKVDFSRRAVFSKVKEYNRAQVDLIFCEYISITILFQKIITNFNLFPDSMIEHIYIYIENIRRIIWKPCTHTFSPAVISKCLRIRAQSPNS